MATVALDRVSLVYPGGASGLANVSLEIADGEFIALVGASGSGKTTLLRLIAGFLEPTTGSVLIGGKDVTGVPPERRHLGMVFQQHAIWPHWSVLRNVAYPLRLAGVARAERRRRALEALDLVGLAGFERRDPATLSGGQRQRVALARALVNRPGVLLLDEAFSALDEPLRDRLRIELQELTRELGLTVVLVTHDRGEALALADRIVVLDSGRVQQVGAPSEILERPASATVARFMSDASLIAGRCTKGGGFASSTTPFSLEGGVLTREAGAAAEAESEAVVAVLPTHVRLHRDERGEGVIESSQFGRAAHTVTVRWRGEVLRALIAGERPAIGDRVSVVIEEARVFGDCPLAAVSGESAEGSEPGAGAGASVATARGGRRAVARERTAV